MRTNLWTEAFQWTLVAAMFVLGVVAWPSAPETVPIHWDFSGQPDGYAGKFVGLFGLPMLALVVYLAMLFLPRVDPMRANYDQFRMAYTVFRVATLTVVALVYGFILIWIRGVQLDVTVVAPVLVGGLFVVIGNLLGKIRPNWFVGIKAPWTLSSRRSWTKTHRLAGWLFVLMGLAFIGLGLMGLASSTWTNAAFLALVAGCVLWVFVYSYLVWRSDPEKAR